MDEAARFLVTGAQGFLGRHIVQALLACYPNARILGVGRSPCTQECFTHSLSWSARSFHAPLPAYLRQSANDVRYRYEVLDLSDPMATRKTIQEFQPDVVFHLASGLKGDPVDCLLRNGVESTVWLLEALGSARGSRARLLFCSSGGVYGRVPESLLPIQEDAPTRPADLYALSKLAAEHASRILGEKYGIPVVWARVFNLVGPGQDERHVCGKFAAQAVAISLGLQEPRLQTADLCTTRDFIDVRDCARAMVLLSAKGTLGEIYNVASGAETTITLILDTILGHLGLSDRVSICSSAESPNQIRRHYASTLRLSALGFRPELSMADSLRDLVDYYLQEVSALCQ